MDMNTGIASMILMVHTDLDLEQGVGITIALRVSPGQTAAGSIAVAAAVTDWAAQAAVSKAAVASTGKTTKAAGKGRV